MHRLVSFIQYGVIWLACVLAIGRVAKGDFGLPEQNVTVAVDEVGDAKVSLTFTVPEATWKQLKKIHASGETLLRLNRLDNLIHARDEFKVQYGKDWSITVDYHIAGLARREGDGWEIAMRPWGNLISTKTGQLIASDAVLTDHGLMDRRVKFTFPTGTAVPKLSGEKAVVVLPAPPARTGTTAKAVFDLDVQERLMGCMAKSYGYEKFGSLWAARTHLKNMGDVPITDYRVRFRLSEFAMEWSPWSRTSTIAAGQSVVDAYFPLLNIEKISALQGRRQAVLEVEYEYTLAGKQVKESDARKLEILGKNEPAWSNVPPGESFGWLDENANMNFVLGSFVTKDDPVIGMAAGQISGQMHGSPSVNPNDAIEYVRQIHRYVLHNKIAYQTPPVAAGLQHVKYGREVLANHSGTCIDLAIFYASVGEAVGLRPVLCLPPGHCFPMFRMPRFDTFAPDDKSKEAEQARVAQAAWEKKYKDYVVKIGADYYLPFEATAVRANVTFEQAVAAGKQAFNETPVMGRVDIARLRSHGVYPLELPDLGANALDQWHITAAPAAGKTPAAAKEVGDPAKLIVGTWRADVVIAGQQMYILGTFKDDGTVSATTYNAANQPLGTGGGNWSFTADGTYQFRGPIEEDAKVQFTDADTFVYTTLKTTNPIGVVGARVTNKRVK